MSYWSHIILEAFCSRKWGCRKNKYHYMVVSTNPFKTKKVENKQYDPNYKTPKKPKYCKDRPSHICLENGCQFLAFTNAENDDYEWLNKRYDKMKKERKKD